MINKATGDAKRFNQVYEAYKNGKNVTASRLYIETMEEILSNADTTLIDPSAKGANVLPILPLQTGENK